MQRSAHGGAPTMRQIEAERASAAGSRARTATASLQRRRSVRGSSAAFALGWREAWEQHGERSDERPCAGLLADAEAWRRWE